MIPRGLLPADVVADLKAASEIADPATRIRAIDAARSRAARRYPKLFKKEEIAMKVKIQSVRVAFPAVFEPQAIDGGEPKFGGKFIIDPANKALVAELDAAMLQVAKDKWGPKGEQVFNGLQKVGKKPDVAFVKEPYKNKDGDAYGGFEDMFYLSASSATRPLVIDRDKTPLVNADGKIYSGCYVNINVEFWAQDNKFGRAIRAQLRGVQFAKDGDAFGGGAPASTDEFDDLSAEAEGLV